MEVRATVPRIRCSPMLALTPQDFTENNTYRIFFFRAVLAFHWAPVFICSFFSIVSSKQLLSSISQSTQSLSKSFVLLIRPCKLYFETILNV